MIRFLPKQSLLAEQIVPHLTPEELEIYVADVVHAEVEELPAIEEGASDA